MPKKGFYLAIMYKKNLEAVFLLKSSLGNSPKKIEAICHKAGFLHVNVNDIAYWSDPRNNRPGIPVYLLSCLEKASGIKRETLRPDIPWKGKIK